MTVTLGQWDKFCDKRLDIGFVIKLDSHHSVCTVLYELNRKKKLLNFA